jgi:hypothetical protein
MLILVGNALYGASAAAAALVEAEPPELAVDAAFEAVAPPDDDELEELDEPQAASARASITVPTIARYPRGRSRLLLRRSSLESCVMLCVSFRCELSDVFVADDVVRSDVIGSDCGVGLVGGARWGAHGRLGVADRLRRDVLA